MMKWINQIRPRAIARSWRTRSKQASTVPSPEYTTWQRRFFYDRLGLGLWLALVILLTFNALDVYKLYAPVQEVQPTHQKLQDLTIAIDIVTTALLLLCLGLHKTRFGRRYPAWVFLGASWSVTVVPQILATWRGFPLPDVLGWTLVLLLQATLIPVRWELHLVSQLGLLIYFYGVNSVLGLTVIPAPAGHQERSIFLSSLVVYLFWFCFVCNLAVSLYERLQQAEFESRRQVQLFIHAVSHDLRNPVTGTLLLLKKWLKTSEDTVTLPRSLLERIVESGDRQLSLINSLLEVGDARGVVVNPQPIALATLLNQAIADLEPLLIEQQATLVNDIPALPLVNADQVQIWRVVSNLIANALQHNPPGIAIVLSAEVDSGFVRCSIQDNGLGMTIAESRHIFELYMRGQGRRSLGFGLGLYLCRRIILAHGGTIGITSSPGAGATFWFTLPIAPHLEPD